MLATHIQGESLVLSLGVGSDLKMDGRGLSTPIGRFIPLGNPQLSWVSGVVLGESLLNGRSQGSEPTSSLMEGMGGFGGGLALDAEDFLDPNNTVYAGLSAGQIGRIMSWIKCMIGSGKVGVALIALCIVDVKLCLTTPGWVANPLCWAMLACLLIGIILAIYCWIVTG